MPKSSKKKKKFINKKDATTYRLIPGYVDDDESPEKIPEEEIEARKEEQRKHGIFFDDSYNYMKHLRSLTEQAALVNNEQFQLLVQDQ
ncbi:Protein ltv1, partial [Bulinus truncatus]